MELLQQKQIILAGCPPKQAQWLMQILTAAQASVVNYPHLVGNEKNGMITPSFAQLKTCDLLIYFISEETTADLLIIQQLLDEESTPAVIGLINSHAVTLIEESLRYGIHHLLFTPLNNQEQVIKEISSVLQPQIHLLQQRQQLDSYWQEMSQYTHGLKQLLQQLQPPVVQKLASCHLSYRRLNEIGQMGLIFDIAQINDDAFAFYCLDLSLVDQQGYVAALVLRSVFNKMLKRPQLPTMASIFKHINKLLRQNEFAGQYPLLLGYYHKPSYELLLAGAGMQVKVKTADNEEKRLNSHLPLGTLQVAYFHQIRINTPHHYWQCYVNSQGGPLSLTCRPDK